MENIQKLNQYLQNYFPSLKLCMPLFYNAEIGIRFEIGEPEIDINDKRYIQTAYLRSIQLFEEVFSKDDDIFLVVNKHFASDTEYEIADKTNVFPSFFVSKENIEQEVDSEEIPFCYLEEDEEIREETMRTIRYCCKYKLSKIKYKKLLKAIANQDLGYKPAVTDEVYFINIGKHIIYQLYDDRGLDLVSNSKDSLEDIYIKYNSWILDYDRERIDKLFKL